MAAVPDNHPTILSIADRLAGNPNQTHLEVVGSCPRCGAPVYGYQHVLTSAQPEVRFSCDCRNQQHKSIHDTMRTT